MKTVAKFAALFAAFAVSVTPATAETILINAGSVIVDADSDPTGPRTIVVTDGVITNIVDVDAAARIELEAEASRIIDLSDKTVLPGLIDLHTHLSGDPSGEFWRAATTPPSSSTTR